MSPTFWNDLQMVSDSCYNVERSDNEGSALFARQPHWGTQEPDFAYPTFSKDVKVFKDIATVPNITLNFAQMKDVMPDGNLTWSPALSSSSTNDDSDTPPPLSLTPASINSDLPSLTISDQILNSLSRFSCPTSPLSSNSPYTIDDENKDSPLSEKIGLSSLAPFTDLHDQPEFHQQNCNSRVSLPVSTICPAIDTNYETIVRLDEQEEKPTTKRRRYASSEPKLKPPCASPPSHRKGTRIGKNTLNLRKVTAARTTESRGAPSQASISSKPVLELSSGDWLKLSPTSMTEQTLQATSHPSPPYSSSPSATPEPSKARKRKRAITSPFVTHRQSPLPSISLSMDRNGDTPSPVSSVSDGLNESFITAAAMIQRRSERIKAPISYVGCDEDVFEKPARGSTIRMKAKATSDEFKAQGRRTLLKKGRRGGLKLPQNTSDKCQCPFQIICPIPFGRFSDVVRHLESNVLHTHAEKARWECPNCGSRLARSDSYKRHVNAHACGKRAPTEKVKPVYSPEVERELERIRNSDHPAVLAAKERL